MMLFLTLNADIAWTDIIIARRKTSISLTVLSKQTILIFKVDNNMLLQMRLINWIVPALFSEINFTDAQQKCCKFIVYAVLT